MFVTSFVNIHFLVSDRKNTEKYKLKKKLLHHFDKRRDCHRNRIHRRSDRNTIDYWPKILIRNDVFYSSPQRAYIFEK